MTKSPFIIRKNGWKSTSMGKACFIVNTVRSSHRRCSMKKGVLRNSTKFTGKHLCHSLFFNKVAALNCLLLDLVIIAWLWLFAWVNCLVVSEAFLTNTSKIFRFRFIMWPYVRQVWWIEWTQIERSSDDQSIWNFARLLKYKYENLKAFFWVIIIRSKKYNGRLPCSFTRCLFLFKRSG